MHPAPDAEGPVTPVAWYKRLTRALAKVEDAALVILLALLVALAFGQIALRQLQVNIAWGDPVTRLLVLWVGVAGAVAASRANEHVNIDVISHFLPPRIRHGVLAITSLFASGVCAFFAFQSARFVQFEREGGASALDGVPDWVLALALPLGFMLIALRYALFAVGRLRSVAAPEQP
jgi:TRAP-type C4-dicarboxylate transport system permease small subunit